MRRLIFSLALTVATSVDARSQSSILEMIRWEKCTFFATTRFALSSIEPAEIIVSAAFGSCKAEERAYLLKLIEEGAHEPFGELSKTEISIRRDQLISQVLSARASHAK